MCLKINKEDEEDIGDLPIASLPKRRVAVGEKPAPKRPITRLKKKDALKSAIKNSQNKSWGRQLVKDGKFVNEKIVPIVSVDD